MRSPARLAVVVVAALVLAGCGGKTLPCAKDTAFVTLTYAGAAADADQVAISVTVDGTTMTYVKPHPAGGTRDTLEINFVAGYPKGKVITVAVAASRTGTAVGAGRVQVTLEEGCSAIALAVTGDGLPDLVLLDGGAVADSTLPADATVPVDAAVPVDATVSDDATVSLDLQLLTDATVRPDTTTLVDATTLPDQTALPDLSGCPVVGAGARHFVNPQLGVNDSVHGGGTGACAYKTLTYALSQASGEIGLAMATYSSASGETMPFVLSGAQKILCDPTVSGNQATLTSTGKFNGIDTIVVLTGDGDGLDRCIVDGNFGSFTFNIWVRTVAVVPDGHAITSTTSRNGQVGIYLDRNGGNLLVSQSTIRGNTYGINTDNTPSAKLINNVFFGNSNLDVGCNTPAPAITGSGNTLMGGGVIDCVNCMNCPF